MELRFLRPSVSACRNYMERTSMRSSRSIATQRLYAPSRPFHNNGLQAQRAGIDDYYDLILNQSLSQTAQATETPPAAPPPPKTEDDERIAKARVVFGSRLASPIDRRDAVSRQSTSINGILVPPRPDEPDNCCMSGCVNCVWDQYRDELEEWAARSTEARSKAPSNMGGGVDSGTIDDDGGGSETNWSIGLASTGDELMKGIPVGIREFMRTEKRLKAKHARERIRE